MRTWSRVALLAMALWAMGARPAQASWLAFYDYLEHLSGPGPFRGIGVEVPIACRDDGGETIVSWNCTAKPQPRVEGGALPGRLEISVHASRMFSGKHGDLEYEGTRPDIAAFAVGAGVKRWWTPHLGGTAHVTVVRFTGDGVDAGDVILRLGPILSTARDRRFSVYASPQLQLGLGPFAREDFGARPGRRLTEPVRGHVELGATFSF